MVNIMKLPRWMALADCAAADTGGTARQHQLNRWGGEEGDSVASVRLKTNEDAAVTDTVS